MPKEDKKICNEYNGFVILFYDRTFSILGFWFPFNGFKVEHLNNLIIFLLQFNVVSLGYIKVF